MRMFKKLILTGFLTLTTVNAYSLINGEILYGPRWFSDTDVAFAKFGKALTLGLHLDPLPFIPISIGASYTNIVVDKKDIPKAGAAEINQVGIDFKIWAPMVPFFTPYARLRYLASSSLKVTYDDGSRGTENKIKGSEIGVGLKYKIFLMVDALLEYTQSYSTARIDNAKERDLNFQSKSVSLGLEAGV